MRILVVEDDILTQMHVVRSLQEIGCQIVGAVTHADAAVSQARNARPDVVFMDIRLARGSDGVQAARRIRNTSNVQVAFVSGALIGRDLERAQGIDHVGMLEKPFFPGDLVRFVDEVKRNIEKRRVNDVSGGGE